MSSPALRLFPFCRRTLAPEELFKTVAVLGSGPSAKELSGKAGDETIVLAVNNAWRAFPGYSYLVYSDNLPAEGKPAPLELSRRGISSPQYWPAMAAHGGLLYCGATMGFAAGYWALTAFPYAQISFFAADMVYEGSQTHFYGQGAPDPLRRDLTLQDLQAKSLRLFYLGLERGCLFLNASASASSRLGFPRDRSGRCLRVNVLGGLFETLETALEAMRPLARRALELESNPAFDWHEPNYGRYQEDPAAWAHLAEVDRRWRALEPLVTELEPALQRALDAKAQ